MYMSRASALISARVLGENGINNKLYKLVCTMLWVEVRATQDIESDGSQGGHQLSHAACTDLTP